MKEKNLAIKLCKNYRKAIANQPIPKINQLHEELQRYNLAQHKDNQRQEEANREFS
jgi:hypothetical protein